MELLPIDALTLDTIYKCMGVAGSAFGGAYVGFRCARGKFREILEDIRDEHLLATEALVDRGIDNPVSRVIRKVVEPLQEAMHQEVMDEIRRMNALMLRVVEGYQQLRMQAGLIRDTQLDEDMKK